MPKEIDESKLNYNKYPGEHVIAVDDVVKIGSRTFHVVANYREGFNAEKLEQRFSDVFDKYDYIVGDWGHEQLRLKGFFSASRKKMQAENKIDHLEDYINEYCNYGCAYFVLRRIRTRDEREAAYTKERVFEEREVKPKFDKPRRKRNRNRNDRNDDRQKREDKPVSADKSSRQNKNYEIREKNNKNKPKNNRPRQQRDKIESVSSDKPTFVIRPRKSNKE